jgi:IMP dehydrogenase/GMP reductase
MLIKEMKYSYNDIAIVPAIKSNVEHRSECNPFLGQYSKSYLPIFTAPMSTVVNVHNFELFEQNHIIPILPRNFPLETRIYYLKRGKWAALGLQEFEDLFLNNDWDMELYPEVNVLIDIANGHMSKLHNLIYDAKVKYKWSNRFKIMAGNIANPQTYYELAKAGVDFVRLSVGSGAGCITSTQTGVHYPIASLINETYQLKKKLEHAGEWTPLIIADGGIRNYSDVIKSLALGSDYIMIGSVFASLIESAAPTFYYQNDGKSITEINPFEHKIDAYPDGTFDIDEEHIIDNLHKVFYGMASRRGQEDINGEKKKTSEGIQKILPATTNLRKWSENMVAYMQSIMSYTNCYYIDDFNPENIDCIIISNQTKESINK